MWNTIIRIFKTKNLRDRIIFTLAMLVIFRISVSIPIPGVDKENLIRFLSNNQFFGLLNIFSGGALNNLSVGMLGLGPYITATIIFQLLTMIFPGLKEMYQEDGEAGRKKFNQYARFLSLPLAALQGFGLLKLLESQNIINLTNFNLFLNVIVIMAGTSFLMWLGELISEKGISNGISLLIAGGIIAGFPQALKRVLATFTQADISGYLMFLVIAFLTIVFVVIITEAQRNIPIQYAKRVRGFKLYGGVSTYLPLRLNMAGVIPIIFAISVLLFPSVIANLIGLFKIQWLLSASSAVVRFFQNPWIYGSSYFFLVVVFTYFYTAVTFDPKQMSENLQKQGGFIPGIRPGQPTAFTINFILNRITLSGALFLGIIAVLPYIVTGVSGISSLSLGGTSLLILVSVILEIAKQIKAQISMTDYERI
ncbi:preprotein translocase subunit SecY [Candidatus Azambacteria bacterium]|nr:preprotein translocase subunit SecY [Candidatus Azambacteria bacterium]